MINEAGMAILREFEGCKLTSYKDIAGVWTIGYGHTGPDVVEGLVWRQTKADAQLSKDVAERVPQVLSACKVEPNENQLAALVCLAFNIGIGAFKKSTVLRLHNAGSFAEAATAFSMWNKAGGRVRAGLTRRRAAEAALYLTPIEADAPQTTRATPDASKDPSAAGDAINKTAAMLGQGSALVAPLLAYSPIWDAVSDRVANPTHLIWGAGAIVIGLLAYNSYMTYRRRQEGAA